MKSQPTKDCNPIQNENEPSISFKEARDILNTNGANYTDEQVNEIRHFLEMMADIIVDNNLLSKM